MLEALSLRQRVIGASTLLTAIVCSVFAAAAWHAIDGVEDQLIDRRLALAADHLAPRLLAGERPDLPPNVTLYLDRELPAALQGLAVGRHELALAGSSVNVLVRQSDGIRFTLVDADDDFEGIKQELYALLAAACLGCLALAWAFGRATASRVIAPLTALARAVEQDQRPDSFPALGASDELGVLARAFASRTCDLQQMVKREQWFVADVSHELRTPLTVILGAAEILQHLAGQEPEVGPLAERIRRTAAETAARVAALLLLSRKPEAIDTHSVALAPVIQQEIDRCRPLLDGKSVTLSFEQAAEVVVQASPELVAMAIGNLIDNACRYTESGSIDVRLEPHRVVVRDTGIGVPAGLREQIFERHVRARHGRPDGAGLGLAIVSRVALHLGWRVALEAGAVQGSVFSLNWDDPRRC